MNPSVRSLFAVALISIGSTQASGQDFEFNYHSDYPLILAQAQDHLSPLSYTTLLQRFQVNDTTLTDFEVLALLIGFIADPEYKPYAYLIAEKNISALNVSGEYRNALAACDSFLLHVPVSQSAIADKAYAFHMLDMPDSSEHYSWKHTRIMRAMARTGDGHSAGAAIFSLGPADGQDYIKSYLHGRLGAMDSGADENGDVVNAFGFTPEIAPEGSEEVPLYFQIQHVVDHMFTEEDRKRMNDGSEPGEDPEK